MGQGKQEKHHARLKFATIVAVNDPRDTLRHHVLLHLGPNGGCSLIGKKIDCDPTAEVIDDDHEVALCIEATITFNIRTEVYVGRG